MAFYKFIQQFKFKKIILSGLFLIFIYQVSLFTNRYFVHLPVRQPWHRQNYLSELVSDLSVIGKDYEEIVITKEPATNLFFYQKTPPFQVQQIMKTAGRDKWGFVYLNKFNNYIFMPIDCPLQGKENVLYVCRGQQVPYNSKIIKVIRYADGLPARIFLEFVDQEPRRTKELPWRIEVIPETMNKFKLINENEKNYW